MAETKQAYGYAGKPIGARRDDSGEITHILFQYRQRAMPIYSVRRAIKAGRVVGLMLDQTNAKDSKVVLNGDLPHLTDLDDLPEI